MLLLASERLVAQTVETALRHRESLLLAVHLVVCATEEFLYFHLALELHHAIEDSLWAWRAARHIHVDRHNLRDSAHHVV